MARIAAANRRRNKQQVLAAKPIHPKKPEQLQLLVTHPTDD
jgi:hypothetical protein